MENYFNYFTEIEDHFQRRRGTLLILSPLDWALMETWKDAGIPLEAVLRGIDATFDKWERRPRKTRKVNGLAFCAQEVLASAEEMKEAAVGAPAPSQGKPRHRARSLSRRRISSAQRRSTRSSSYCRILRAIAWPKKRLRHCERLAAVARQIAKAVPMEDLERRLTVSEEKLFAALLAATPDEALYQVRAEADRDLAPYRRKMTAPQIEQLQKQYVHKRLLEQYHVPRLSLFYM